MLVSEVDLRDYSATGMRYIVEQKKKIDVLITLKPCYLIIPHNGVYIEYDIAIELTSV